MPVNQQQTILHITKIIAGNQQAFRPDIIYEGSDVVGEIIVNDRFRLICTHDQSCCENVYAAVEESQYFPTIPIDDDKIDVKQVELIGDIQSPDFIEGITYLGFKIKCKDGYVIVPCYDIQNGYYSSNLTITCFDMVHNKELWHKDLEPFIQHTLY